MKHGRDSKKTDGDSTTDPVNDGEGIDAFKVLQAGAGIICLILVAWFILHNVLHII